MRQPTTSGAIVYLVEPYYQIERLEHSVQLLFMNYNAVQRDDVIFFTCFNTSMSPAAQQKVLQFCTEGACLFQELPRRRMSNRFLAIGFLTLLAQMGYQYVMRIDERSKIWSPISYNIFAFMRTHALDHGFRLAQWQRGSALSKHTDSLLHRRAAQNLTALGWLSSSCLHEAPETIADCGRIWTIFPKFFVTAVSFWQQPDVRDLLSLMPAQRVVKSRSEEAHARERSDSTALWQTLALAFFSERRRVHSFDDFAFEHSTFRAGSEPGCLLHGGLVLAARALSPTARAGFSQAAEARLANLTAASLACGRDACARYRRCVYSGSCLYATNRVTETSMQMEGRAAYAHNSPYGKAQGLFAGAVSPEQPTCHRSPQPYFCDARPLRTGFNSSSNQSFRGQLRYAAVQCLKGRRGARPERQRKTCRQRVIARLAEEKQHASLCANWCEGTDDTAAATVRQKRCLFRAATLWSTAGLQGRDVKAMTAQQQQWLDAIATPPDPRADLAFYHFHELATALVSSTGTSTKEDPAQMWSRSVHQY